MKNAITEIDIAKIAGTYHKWQQKKIKNVPEYCYSARFEEIEAKDFSLVPSKYIEFINRDENIDFNDKMTALKNDFTALLK